MNSNNTLKKYDSIGDSYNATRNPDPFLVNRMQEMLDLKSEDVLLDIGCGTGNYTAVISNNPENTIGVDPSNVMLEQANNRSSEIQWKIGNAESIPLEENQIDKTLASLTLHHWMSLDKGFKELNRVSRKEAKLLIFTSTKQQMRGYWLNEYFPVMMKASIDQMPSRLDITKGLESSGWRVMIEEKYFIKDDIEDKFLYAGKHSPHLYFDDVIRQGISSFSHLSNREEVSDGLKRLRADIDSGKIIEVQQQYENDIGDYLFILAQKY